MQELLLLQGGGPCRLAGELFSGLRAPRSSSVSVILSTPRSINLLKAF